METYEIVYAKSVRTALVEIGKYIENSLKAPQAAANTVRAIVKGINSLDFMPQRYAVLPEDFLEKEGIRRMQVRNYFVYFSIDEDKKCVTVLDVLYVGREQKEKLETDE